MMDKARTRGYCRTVGRGSLQGCKLVRGRWLSRREASTAQIALLAHTGSTAKQIDSILVSITAVNYK